MRLRGRSAGRYRPAIVTLCATLALLTTPDPASAAESTLAVCTFEVHETASPGFGNMPSQGTSVTNPGGTITCSGTVDGQELSSEPGTIWYRYDFATRPPSNLRGGDTCYLFSGTGPIEVTLPTSDGGTVTVSGAFAENRGTALGAETNGYLGDAEFEFLNEFRLEEEHLDENCIEKPIEHFVTTGQGVVIG